jgi:fatty acid desaturase
VRYLVRNRFQVLRDGNRSGALTAEHVPSLKKNLDRAAFWIFWGVIVGVAWQLGGLGLLALFWVIPYLTSFQILGWYIELSEHTPLVRDHDVDLYMTRNRKSRGLERFLTGIHNDHFHLDHHLDPRTPFWNLPKTHRVRLADPHYAQLDAMTGGLVTKGPQGAVSAISSIVTQLSTSREFDRVIG